TPSKRIRLMTAGLATTSSGSFLVSKARVTSAHKISAPVINRPPILPQPDWSLITAPRPGEYETKQQLLSRIEALTSGLELAQQHVTVLRAINEGANAQLVIQDMLGQKQNESLYSAENKKKTDRTKLFPEGKGRHLTDEKFIRELQAGEKAKTDNAAAKAKRRVDRAAKKVAKVAAEKEWQAAMERHKEDVKNWEDECKRLRDQKVLKKDLPKKPARPVKPKPAKETQGPDGS
ncbi:hypothetical protein BD410DRAFT_689367, partial [Rickenella mellea]